MKKGLVVKLIGGLYSVKELGTNNIIKIKPRGNLRYQGTHPKVGDVVEFNLTIDNVIERKNDMIRPYISNVDQALLIFSSTEPKISYSLLDRFLSLIENNDIEPIIIITKLDLCDDIPKLKAALEYYSKYYSLYYVSAETNVGLEELKSLFKDKISVITGQTGVGKSSLLNKIADLNLRTNEISKSLGRGKHTTRHVELFEIHEGLVADTPGFSSLEFIDMDKDDLRTSYKDFNILSQECKYRSCFHDKEPIRDCKVKQLVESGVIPKSRYDNFIIFLNEISNIKVKY